MLDFVELSYNLLSLSDNKLDVSVMNIDNKNVLLIGEDHYKMDKFFDTNEIKFEQIIHNLLEVNADIIVEAQPDIDENRELWENFVIENELQYEVPKEHFVDKNIVTELIKSNKTNIIKLDTREIINGYDGIHFSNISNIIMNHFQYFSKDEKLNDHIFYSIINLIEISCIKKVILYLLKKQRSFDNNSKIYSIYSDTINDIKVSYKNFINYLREYRDNMQSDDINLSDEINIPNEKLVESVVYGISAKILDLNIVEYILTKDKNNFIVYVGDAHRQNIKKILEDCDFN